MAAAAAATAEAPAKSGASLVVQLGALVGLSLAAAGAGWFSGKTLGVAGQAAEAKAAHAAPAGHGAPAKSGGHEPAADPTVVPLPELTTNLAAPSDTWVRAELSVVFDEPPGHDMAGIISQDFLAYLRTLKLHQIEGASGFAHLKADLEERAGIRSDGHAKRVLIRTLLFE